MKGIELSCGKPVDRTAEDHRAADLAVTPPSELEDGLTVAVDDHAMVGDPPMSTIQFDRRANNYLVADPLGIWHALDEPHRGRGALFFEKKDASRGNHRAAVL